MAARAGCAVLGSNAGLPAGYPNSALGGLSEIALEGAASAQLRWETGISVLPQIDT